MAQALEESSLEPLAVDQHPLPSGPKHETRAEIQRPDGSIDLRTRLRLLEHERVATTNARRSAEQKLDQAERELAGLGFLGRRRRAPALEAEITAQREVIRVAGTTLAGIEKRRQALRSERGSLDRGRELAAVSTGRTREQSAGVGQRAPGLEL
jgi:hypothetical protein